MLNEYKVYRDNLFVVLDAYDLPVGIYLVEEKSGVEYIKECNGEFVRMFHFSSIEEARDTLVSDLYRSSLEYEAFQKKLAQALLGGEWLRGYNEVLMTKSKSLLAVEVHCRVDKDEKGKIIGRIGIVFDITETELLLTDIGNVLHVLGTAAVGLQERLAVIRDALCPAQYSSDPFGDLNIVPPAEDVAAQLARPAGLLRRAVSNLLKEAEQEERILKALSSKQWEELKNRWLLLENYEHHISRVQHRPSALRQAARDIINIARNIKPGIIHRELIRNIIEKADELERLGCLYALHYANGRIIEMGNEVEVLRELALYDLRYREGKTVVTVSSLIEEARDALIDLAEARRIDIDVRDLAPEVTVNVVQREMVRALRNLLHNAIKYSWHKYFTRPWVKIRSEIRRPYVTIEFENHGVPIPREEIETELIFKLGFRGQKSGDRNRPGTGMGLYDARRVARSHQGDVIITSHPASGDNPDDLSQPFITVATITIPIWRETR